MQLFATSDFKEIDSDMIKRLKGNNRSHALYPGLASFADTFNPEAYINQINHHKNGGNRRPLSINIRFPLCNVLQLDNSSDQKRARHNAFLNEYIDYLIKEIRLLGNTCQHTPRIEQIYIGGDAQALLDHRQFNKFMREIHKNFKPVRETFFCATIDPRLSHNQSINIFREIGVNDITIHAQHFSVQDSHRSYRKQAASAAHETITLNAIHAAQHAGFTTIRITLDCGRTEQANNTFDYTLEKIIAAHPHRIELCHAGESTKENVTQAQIHARIHVTHLLSDAGYTHIGLNSFARHEDPLVKAQQQGRLHYGIQGHSTFPDSDFLALGVSAIGKMGTVLLQNHLSLSRYYKQLDRNQLPVLHGLELSLDDLLRRSVIHALICHAVVSFESVETFFSIDFKQYFATELTALLFYEKAGLLHIDHEEMIITAKGRLFIDSICSAFDKYSA